MTDREKIVSNDYYDLITDYIRPPFGDIDVQDIVFQPVEGELGITYVNRNEAVPLNITEYTYPVWPKVYGLMQLQAGSGQSFDPTPLIRSGITQIQREPLNLTGKGVVIGFLDTGAGVKELPLTVRPLDWRGLAVTIIEKY